MPRQKDNMGKRNDIAATFRNNFGSTVKALSPEFKRALKPVKKQKSKPTHRNGSSKATSKATLSKLDEPSLKKKQKTASSRRGAFVGKLPTSNDGGVENIEQNSPGNVLLLGVSVKKTFHDEDTGKPRLFYGIVTAYNAKHGLYKVSYEDGDEEELTASEVEEIRAAIKSGTAKRKRSKKKTQSVLENV